MFQYEKRLVSKKELKSVCGIPYTPQHIGRLEAAGKFPKRVNLGPGRAECTTARPTFYSPRKTIAAARMIGSAAHVSPP